jgi:energy-coupling factor transporter ATP-binding protein EcfA2
VRFPAVAQCDRPPGSALFNKIVTTTLAAPPKLGGVRLVAVDGPTGAGKSTLANRLKAAFPAATLISTDDFATWDDPVAWWPRLEEGVLNPLEHGNPGLYQRMEWTDGTPALGEWVTVEVPEVLILEGLSAGRRAVHNRLSCLVWVDFADASARLERSVARDGETSRTHLARWQRFEAGWFQVDRPADRAHQKFHSG